MLRYLSMNTLQKPFDNPKVREAIDYAINKEALAKVAFNGYATPADGVVPEGVEYAVKLGPWPYDVAKAKQLLTEAGYPNGFETELWSAYNHSDRAEGDASSCSSSCSRSASGRRSRCSKPASASRRSRAGRTRRPRRCASTTSAGRRRPAKPTGRCARCSYGDSWPPKLFNTAYYKNDKVDADIKGALADDRQGARRRSSTRMRRRRIWKDAPWAPLVTEKLLSAHSKKLSGVYVMPDASFNFTDVDLK